MFLHDSLPAEYAEYIIDNRYANTFLYDLYDGNFLVAQRFPGLEGVGDAFLGFLFTAKRDKGFALEIENVLFADQLGRSERATGQDIGEFAADVGIVFGGVAAAQHHVNGKL